MAQRSYAMQIITKKKQIKNKEEEEEEEKEPLYLNLQDL